MITVYHNAVDLFLSQKVYWQNLRRTAGAVLCKEVGVNEGSSSLDLALRKEAFWLNDINFLC